MPPLFHLWNDLHIEVTPLPHSALAEKKLGEPSAVIRQRVIAARKTKSSSVNGAT